MKIVILRISEQEHDMLSVLKGKKIISGFSQFAREAIAEKLERTRTEYPAVNRLLEIKVEQKN